MWKNPNPDKSRRRSEQPAELEEEKQESVHQAIQENVSI